MRRESDSCLEYCDSKEIHFYHICTKGLEDRLLFQSDEDYQRAINILAINAYLASVRIFAYCLMSNHLHLIAGASDYEQAVEFANVFKRDYSRFHSKCHKKYNILRHVAVTVKEIGDIPYLRNCVAYVLKNPVEGGLVKSSEQYPWSSIGCYFAADFKGDFRPVNALTARERRLRLFTHHDIIGSNILVDFQYRIVPRSFVDYKLVEDIFNHSQEFFWTRISKVNSAQLEYDLAFCHNLRYNDYELMVKIEDILGEWFNKTSVSQLDMRERCKVAGYLHQRMNAGIPQIARLLGLDRRTASEILGG